MKRQLSLISLLTLCFFCSAVSATTVLIDPGDVGTEAPSYILNFDDLDGTPLDGHSVELDFVFDDMKHIEVPAQVNTVYQARVRFTTSPTDAIDALSGTGFLSDENGDPLFPASDVVTNVSTNASGTSWTYSFGTPLTAPLAHHDVHFDVPLPSIDDGVIASGSLILQLVPATKENLLRVGEWSPGSGVPEPATVVLMGLGLLGIGYLRRRLA